MQKHEKVQIENKEYSYASVYNVSAIGYLFVNNFKNDKNIFNFIYDISYKLEIGIFYNVRFEYYVLNFRVR